MLEKIQGIINGYGFGITVQDLASELYWQLESEGFEPCIVNDRYLDVDGVTYQIRKTRSKGHWTAVEI